MRAAVCPRNRRLLAGICCIALLTQLNAAIGQNTCPLPTNGTQLCAQLQGQQCQTTVPGSTCQPVLVAYDPASPGLLVALDCTCGAPGECGPVDVQGDIVRCAGICPVPPTGNACQILINGMPSGQSFAIFTQYPPGTTFACGCIPQTDPICLPRSDGQGCQQTQCPDPNDVCRPRCVNISATGAITVVDCDCRQSFECHVELIPGAQPACVGECPPGQVCRTTVTTDPLDGSTTICCDCEPEQQDCGPTSDGSRCKPVVCPIPGEECQPKCILVGLDGTTSVQDCECGSPNACHAEFGPAGPMCIGDCPPGQVCIQRVYTTPAGTLYCCECVDDPPDCEPTTDGQGCKPFNCPVSGEACQPRCARFNPDTGAYQVVDCDCRGEDECHVEFIPGALPQCHGNCPPGQYCVENIVQNADGSFEICCDCLTPECKCPGDMNGDGIINGADIQGFVNCFLGIPTPADNCTCADIDGNGVINLLDVSLFVERILNKESCNPTPCCPAADLNVDLSTGVYDDNTLIPIGTNDDQWVVTCEPGTGGVLPRPAVVIAAHPAWQTIPGTHWISANATGPNGTYCYEYCFCLDERYKNPTLSVITRADDAGQIYLNGNFIGNVGPFNGPAVTVSTSNPGFFQPGENCIRVVVQNLGGVVTGFDFSGSLSVRDGQCCCPPDDLQLSVDTGVDDNTNGLIPIGTNDDTWTVTVDAAGGTVPRPATVINAHPAWLTIPGTRWISANNTGPNGLYVYEYCFCLDPRFKNPIVDLYLRADDAATVWLNGVQIGATPNGWAFNTPLPTHVVATNPALFLPCENCIEVRVINGGGVVTGFNMAGTISAKDGLCCDNRRFSCCLPDGSCVPLLPPETKCPNGGTRFDGPCQGASACCLPDGLCQFLDARCCELAGGTPLPAGTTCSTGAPQACCIETPVGTTCRDAEPVCCEVIFGGTPQGPGTACQGDANQNGIDDACEPEPPYSCCRPDGTCIDLAPGVTQCPDGSPPFTGPCQPVVSCCLPSGACQPLEPHCCLKSGGTPLPAGVTCTGVTQACCIQTSAGGTICRDTDPACCETLYGGTPQGPGTHCLGDANHNHIDDACEPQTPLSCCLADGLCIDLIPGNTTCPDGSPPFTGPCGPSVACCLPNGGCQPLSPQCCKRAGGTPMPAGVVCSSATQACCIQTAAGGTVCRDVDPACCELLYGGIPQGPGTHCQGDLNQNGIDDACEPPVPLSCCLSDGSCVDLAPGTTACPDGSAPFVGPCQTPVACCLPDGSCRPLEKHCCQIAGGSPLPAGVTCSGVTEACCIVNAAGGTICRDADPICCQIIYGGTPQGPGTACQGDANQNGVDDACEPALPISCCRQDGTCFDLPLGSNVCPNGTTGVPGPCDTSTGCCLPDGSCINTDPRCCENAGGVQMPIGIPCSTVTMACCITDPLIGTICRDLDPYCCEVLFGGTVQGAGTACLGDMNQNGIDDACEPPTPFSCCSPDGTCYDLPPGISLCPDGTPSFPGPCITNIACCLPDGSCMTTDPRCCQQAGGSPLPAGVTCAGTTEACCITDATGGITCRDADPICCQLLYGGAPQGPGSHCLGDLNQNGIDDACEPTPPVCGPDPTAPRCLPVQCPISGQECLPKCVIVEPGTQFVIAVADCECKSPNECHIEVTPAPSTYTCVGGCPAGQICTTTVTTNSDGTETVCCQCVPDQPLLCPLPTNPGGQLCANLQFQHCQTPTPDPNQFCAPSLIITNGQGGGVFAEQCACTNLETCGGISVTPDGAGNAFLRCVGPCTNPPGFTCRLIINGNPVVAPQVNSGSLPVGSTVRCGCAQ